MRESAGTQAAIAADSPHTAAAGARIAREGGNVVDIAVAAALAATVAEITMCSLGGSAFLMIQLNGKDAELVDGGDSMPRIPHPPEKNSEAWKSLNLPYGDGIEVGVGHASVAVPGMLAAVEQAWKKHGSLPWSEVVAPALDLSRIEFEAGPTLGRWLGLAGKLLYFQQTASRECFFPDGENPVREGELFRIPHLDQTLECIARHGARALYQGDLARAFHQEMVRHGGYVRAEDLEGYQSRTRSPIRLKSHGFDLALNPGPAIGGAAVRFLISLLEDHWQKDSTPAEQALFQARAQRCLLELREETGAENSTRLLLDPSQLQKSLAALRSPNTTHISAVTGDGSMAAVTLSMGYGAGILIPGTGIACNNSLGEPELNPGGYHSSTPGTRMISNMAPTLARHSDGRCLAIGSPGASRITTSIAQTWIHYSLKEMSFEDAVEAPRLHVEKLDRQLRVQCEPGIDTSLLEEEFALRLFPKRDMYFGAVKLAGLDEHSRFHAVADGRRQGATEIVG